MKDEVIALVGTGVRHVILRRAIRRRGNTYVVRTAEARRPTYLKITWRSRVVRCGGV